MHSTGISSVIRRPPRNEATAGRQTSSRSRLRGLGRRFRLLILSLGLGLLGCAGCTPTVKVATDEPITINLNVKIKHEILVKVDKQLDTLFSEDSDLF